MDIRQVIAADDVTSALQPVVDVETREVVGYEALARGPERPDVLFALARQQGCLRELDEACRLAAFRTAARLDIAEPLSLFVNVEPEALDGATLDQLLAVLPQSSRSPQVVVEVTERALASRPAELLRTLDVVRDLGWAIALDDVGAEPMSLTLMPLLRPDVVKLDLRLVQADLGPDAAHVMTAVNAYAEISGSLVLAEGIETPEHLALAQALGARLGQGWLFGRPSPDRLRPEAATPLALPDTAAVAAGATPFSVLPTGTPLRRAPKRLLVEMSKQLEREAVRVGENCFVAATFQEARHLTPATHARYEVLAGATGLVCALGTGLQAEPMAGVRGASLPADDPIAAEWDLVVLGPHFAAALLARDLRSGDPDPDRMFEYTITHRRETVVAAATNLLRRVAPQVTAPLPGLAATAS